MNCARAARRAVREVDAAPLVSEQAENSQGWGIRHRPAFYSLIGIVFIDIVIQDSFFVFVPFLMLEKNVPTELAAVAVVLVLAGGVFGKFGCGFLAARLGVIKSLIIIELLTAVAIGAVIVAPTMLAFALLPLLGVVLQGSSSITYGAVSELVHESRQTRGFAIIYSTSSTASIIGPASFGIAGDQFGLEVAITAMAVIVLLPIGLCAVLKKGYTASGEA